MAIHLVGEDNGVPFIAMPLLRGETLEARLRRESKLPLQFVWCPARNLNEGSVKALAEVASLEGLYVGPTSDQTLSRLAPLAEKLRGLSIYCGDGSPQDGKVTDAGFRAIGAFRRLQRLDLSSHTASSPSDEVLAGLAALPELRDLVLSFPEKGRRYTPAGIEKIRRLQPAVNIKVDGKEYPATGK